MALAHTLGFPRIGAQRELKFALESFWRGDTSEAALQQTGRTLRARHWQAQADAGLDLVAVGDFAWYDQVLNTLALLGATPSRFGFDAKQLSLDDYFTLARGNAEHFAMEMSKWFDTNYHYLVPEWTADTRFDGGVDWLFDEIAEAHAAGHRAKVVLVGPLTLLYLGKIKSGLTHKLELLPQLLAGYQNLLLRLNRSRHRLGADRRADPGAGAGSGVDRRVRPDLRRLAAGRAIAAADHLLRSGQRTCGLAARPAGGGRASGSGARGRATGRLAAGLAAGQGAVGRDRRWPQHLAQRSGAGDRDAGAGAGGAGRPPVGRLQLLAAACAGRSGAGRQARRRTEKLARVRDPEAGRDCRHQAGLEPRAGCDCAATGRVQRRRWPRARHRAASTIRWCRTSWPG